VFCRFEGNGVVNVKVEHGGSLNSYMVQVSEGHSVVLDFSRFASVEWSRDELTCTQISESVDSDSDGL